MTRSLQRPSRAFVLWLCALLGSVWPLHAWHGLTTVHAVCAEHGELLDLPLAAEHEPEDGLRLNGLEGEEHDACAFAPLAQPAGDGSPRPCLERVLVPVPLDARGPETPRAPTVPRYLLAPKQSPPSGSTS